MPHFDPDSSERETFKLFDDPSKSNTTWMVVGTAVQIIVILVVLRVFMLESGYPFFPIPLVDDLCLTILYEVKELLHQYFPNFR